MKTHQRIGADSNTQVGRDFELLALQFLHKCGFHSIARALPVDVGFSANTAKHNYDLGSRTPPFAVECKCYRWTETGNVPSAKLRALNEAMHYFNLTPDHYNKILFLSRHSHPTKGITLGQYYVQRFGHLIPSSVAIIEFDEDAVSANCVKPATTNVTPELRMILKNCGG